MSIIHVDEAGWHEGEQKMHSLMHVDPYIENPTSPFLTPGGAHLLQTAPLLALGTEDSQGFIWTTVWGGEAGFARSLGSSVVGVKILVDQEHDPVSKALIGEQQDGEVTQEKDQKRPVSGLAIDLATRRRVKFAGQMLAGAIGRLGTGPSDNSKIGEIQLIINVESSLGNCPKYLNKKNIIASLPTPTEVSNSLPLPSQAVQLLATADLFFVSSGTNGSQMSTNYRGGSPGFVRVMSNDPVSVILAYPEYSGNRFYQTLGNLQVSPKAGFVFPDFQSGDVLYVTATTEILSGKDATRVISRSNLVVKISVEKAIFVQRGLAFRGELGERSPYNPPVRFLPSERAGLTSRVEGNTGVNAQLLSRELLTADIARFRFSISNRTTIKPWKAGQYVVLSFEDELGVGYSHMRDDDPKSLNDDYSRTFTVSSPPIDIMPEDEFEITIRNVGVVTKFLFQQNPRAGLEIPLQGFGGDFVIQQQDDELVSFVAGGIGITPLLGQLPSLDLKRLKLFWTIRYQDIGLVRDTFARVPALASSTTLFVSNIRSDVTDEQKAAITQIENLCAAVVNKRISVNDLHEAISVSSRWYICTGSSLKKDLLRWLAGRKVVHEDFDY